jgi:hypothetical protein
MAAVAVAVAVAIAIAIAIAIASAGGEIAFNAVEISLKKGETAV